MAHLIVKLPTLFFTFAALLLPPCMAVHAQASATAAADPQIEALITRMSVEEKVGQLTLFSDFIRAGDKTANPKVREMAAQTLLEQIRAGRVTGVFQGIGAVPESLKNFAHVGVASKSWSNSAANASFKPK